MKVSTCVGLVSQTHIIRDIHFGNSDIHSNHNIGFVLKLKKSLCKTHRMNEMYLTSLLMMRMKLLDQLLQMLNYILLLISVLFQN